jgi:hypothetical protein
LVGAGACDALKDVPAADWSAAHQLIDTGDDVATAPRQMIVDRITPTRPDAVRNEGESWRGDAPALGRRGEEAVAT